ncbi:hypothetical protein D3C72_1872590 [compost metagenome]
MEALQAVDAGIEHVSEDGGGQEGRQDGAEADEQQQKCQPDRDPKCCLLLFGSDGEWHVVCTVALKKGS